MISIFVYLIFVFSLSNVQSFTLTSLGDVTIPTKLENEKVGELKYQKLSKDTSGSVVLAFKLDSNAFDEKFKLTVNEKEAKIQVINKGETSAKGQKIYIIKETTSDSTLYNITFLKLDYAVTGKYVLEITGNGVVLNATSYINSFPIVAKFTKPKLGLEGDPMRITCNYEAYPDATEIRWERLSDLENPEKADNLTFANSSIITQDERIKITKATDTKTENNTLYITSLIKNDTGIYMCTVISPRGSDFAVIKVNVKDRWAALYPFIGIVIEVILLVTAILTYEKYQIRSQNKKNYGENADDDNKEPGIPLAAGGGDDDNVVTDNDIQATEMDAADKTNNIDNMKQRDTATTKNV